MKSRAGIILNKYLAPGSKKEVGVPAATVLAVEDLLNEGAVRKDIFDECVAVVLEEMDDAVEAFKGSEHYSELVEEVRALEIRLGARDKRRVEGGGGGADSSDEEDDGGGKLRAK